MIIKILILHLSKSKTKDKTVETSDEIIEENIENE